MKILSPAISRLARLRYWNIEQWLLNPIDAQREVLQDLVTHAQHTEIGRKYNFHELFSVRDFKEHVPIHEYDDLKSYIERLMYGEQNLLWNTPVYWFAKSSGTTSDKSKFIPVTEESLEDCVAPEQFSPAPDDERLCVYLVHISMRSSFTLLRLRSISRRASARRW